MLSGLIQKWSGKCQSNMSNCGHCGSPLTRVERVSQGDMASDTLVEPLLCKCSKRGGQMLLLVCALCFRILKFGRRADHDASLFIAEEMDIFEERIVLLVRNGDCLMLRCSRCTGHSRCSRRHCLLVRGRDEM